VTIPLNTEQQAAIDAILAWYHAPWSEETSFFLMRGPAGTGKTFTLQSLLPEIKGRIAFTAPTNKATRVLRQTLTRPDYKPECSTIYSLLGLSLSANGEVKELTTPDEPVDLTRYRLVVVDEGSMIGSVLKSHIYREAFGAQAKILIMGDDCQLPPVGEPLSDVFKIPQQVSLTKVMRHDNQILDLVTRVRQQIGRAVPTISLASNNDGEEGVWKHSSESAFLRRALDVVDSFAMPDESKIIAWRNVTVDKYNKQIRQVLFPGAKGPWVPGDRVLFMEPAYDLEGKKVASTDDEGTVQAVSEGWHPEYGDFKVWNVTIQLDTNQLVVARVLHEESLAAFTRRAEAMAQEARIERRKWKAFWEFKEAFHKLRWAYAITAHRAQGSSYRNAFVDWRDILLNRDRQEAYRCLYVAGSRPKTQLHLS